MHVVFVVPLGRQPIRSVNTFFCALGKLLRVGVLRLNRLGCTSLRPQWRFESPGRGVLEVVGPPQHNSWKAPLVRLRVYSNRNVE